MTDKKDIFCNLLSECAPHLLPENLHGLNLKLKLFSNFDRNLGCLLTSA